MPAIKLWNALFFGNGPACVGAIVDCGVTELSEAVGVILGNKSLVGLALQRSGNIVDIVALQVVASVDNEAEATVTGDRHLLDTAGEVLGCPVAVKAAAGVVNHRSDADA